MSFSSDVKRELFNIMPNARHCRIAELAALVAHGTKLEKDRIVFLGDNQATRERFGILSRKLFSFDPENMGEDEIKQLSETIKTDGQLMPDAVVYKMSCCKRAYLRGAFLACGSVTDPGKEYHFEFVTDGERAQIIIELLDFFEIEAKSVERKKYNVVYVKDSDRIVDILNVIEAHVALMDFENVRIVKDVRNSINRRVNCETANLGKTAMAANRQVEDIEYLQSMNMFGQLSDELKETAILRLEYPESSLSELGRLHGTPVGRSGVNHRLSKLSEIAQRLREGK
ncbi:MAG: DNA-binding protein WhiA [Lachnospiraceae bacterium]|nr:DNA-binding protein WhiA [Lachnospiraceae bacterium]